LSPYYDVYGTFARDHSNLEKNKRMFRWDAETESISLLLRELAPDLIITCIRGDFAAQTHAHLEMIPYLIKFQEKINFLILCQCF